MGQQLNLGEAEIKKFWSVRQPQMLTFFDALEKREHWPCKEIERDLSDLVEEVIGLLDRQETEQGADDAVFRARVREMNKVLSAFPCSAAAYLMVWTDREYGQLIYFLLSDCYEGSQESPECNVMWQRAQVMSRYLMLKEIVEDILQGTI